MLAYNTRIKRVKSFDIKRIKPRYLDCLPSPLWLLYKLYDGKLESDVRAYAFAYPVGSVINDTIKLNLFHFSFINTPIGFKPCKSPSYTFQTDICYLSWTGRFDSESSFRICVCPPSTTARARDRLSLKDVMRF